MLDALLEPGSVAVVGASRSPGKAGHEILKNLIAGGYEGRIFPVSPSADEILGLPCLDRIGEAETPPDLAIVALPSEAVRTAVREAVDAGARAVVVVSNRLRGAGSSGGEPGLADICRSRGVDLLGPGSAGVVNSGRRLNASCCAATAGPGGLSVLSRSGAVVAAIADRAAAAGVGLASLVCTGSEANVTEIDVLERFGRDERTRVIACYLESIGEGDRFVRVAESIAPRKPIVILMGGTTSAGRAVSHSHDGGRSEAEIAYGAAFERTGVIRAETIESLVDCAVALSEQPLPSGDRVAIVSSAPGPATIAADAIERLGMRLAARPEAPNDTSGRDAPERFAELVGAALSDPSSDAVLAILPPVGAVDRTEVCKAVAALDRGSKPVLAVLVEGGPATEVREAMAASRIPVMASPERAVAALRALWDHSSWRRLPPRVVARFPVNRHRVQRIIQRQRRMGRGRAGEIEAKEILRAYGFHVPKGRAASGCEEAVEVAERLGYPVVMKIVSPDIVRKNDIGGVRLGLGSADAVRDAFDLMMLRIPRSAPDARIEGVYVERMPPRGREVIIGMRRDRQFGPMLMFGLGGIFVEVMKDVTFHLAPITAEEAMQMLRETRSYALLEGGGAVDIASIASGLQLISQLATDFREISELDINPFIVGGVGADPVVADVRMTISLDRSER